MHTYEVVIIGAGVAGLTAAKQLIAERVTNILVLEAQHYIGGRVKTFHEWGRPIELGAEFIHGTNTITAKMAEELGLETVSAYQDKKLVNSNGEILNSSQKETYNKLLTYTIQSGKPGLSYFDIIEHNPITEDVTIRQLVHMYLNDLELGDTKTLDSGAVLTALNATNYNGHNIMLKDGYQQIVQHLAKDLPIRLESPVKSIDYTDSGLIKIILATNEVVSAKKIIITVSLGVLQHQSIRFIPELPAAKVASIFKLGMGQAMKFIVRFKDPHEVEDLFHYADGENGSLQTITNWWASACDPRVLVGYCGGSRAQTVLEMPEKRLVEKVLDDLSKILGKNLRHDLVDYKISRWDNNPYIYGAYSNFPVGSTNQDRKNLAAPTNNQLFWCGEATVTDGNYATVHGAIGSGYRAAFEVINY